MTKYITVTDGNEGIGSLHEFILDCYFLAKNNGIVFVYTDIKNFQHMEWNGISSQEEWDRFLNNYIKESLLVDYVKYDDLPKNISNNTINIENINEVIMDDILYILTKSKKEYLYKIVYTKPESLLKLTENFLNKNKVISYYKKDVINIAVNIRLFSKTDCCAAESRKLYKKGNETDRYFMNIIKTLSSIGKEIGKNIIFHIFSQYEEHDNPFLHYNDICESGTLYIHSGNDIISDIYHIATANILILSNSSFSGLANYYSSGLTIIRSSCRFPLKNSIIIKDNLSIEQIQTITSYLINI